MKQRTSGFTFIEILLAVVILVVIGVIGFQIWQRSSDDDAASTSAEISADQPTSTQASGVVWQPGPSGWSSTTTPPACPDPLQLTFPSDISTATHTLWPGQERGSQFKPHGGVRYDNTPSGEVEVRAPMDGFIFRIARYDNDGPDQQIMIDVINNCGIWYRFDHLFELADKFKPIFDGFPGDGSTSQTYNIEPVEVKEGELLATKIGFPSIPNVFYDLGVYDLRQKNAASQDPDWAASHNEEQGHYAVCWFDLMPDEVNNVLRNLSTGQEGRTSDYCQ